MKEIVLIGGGGHCKSVIDVIETEEKYRIAGIVDKPDLLNSNLLGYKIIGNDTDLDKIAKDYEYALITIGQIENPLIRVKLYNIAIKSGFKLPSIISPNAYFSKHSKIGKGTVIMHNSVVNANSVIGDNCIINSKVLIEHDCKINNNCHISTNATINGGVIVGSESFIGSGAILKQSIKIQNGSFIKAGQLVK